jgi:hypothetical protein
MQVFCDEFTTSSNDFHSENSGGKFRVVKTKKDLQDFLADRKKNVSDSIFV